MNWMVINFGKSTMRIFHCGNTHSKQNGTGSVYLFVDEATSFMSGIIELKNNYDEFEEMYLIDTYL